MSIQKGLSLDDPVRFVKGVGPKKAALLANLGILTVRDLLDHFPFRLDDFSSVTAMRDVQPGDEVTVQGLVTSMRFVGSQRGRALRVSVSDGTGTVHLVWYNMTYMYQHFPTGRMVVASGRAEWRRGGIEIAHPIWFASSKAVEKGPVIPVYHASMSFTSQALHKIIGQALSQCLDQIRGDIPPGILRRYGYLQEREAYLAIHQPQNAESWQKARRTLAFREILYLQIGLMVMRKEAKEVRGPKPFSDLSLADGFVQDLPFVLTGAQKRAIADIKKDLTGGSVMNRLLQGDVGSGKTVVAVYALLAAIGNGYQGALLAPTEVLARQHKRTLESMCGGKCSIGFLSGSVSAKEKKETLKRLESGEIQLLIGTHAMLERGVKWNNLGLVVTDEQHRFGVRQRLRLSHGNSGDAGNSATAGDSATSGNSVTSGNLDYAPHILVMSATPIPRSLALTLFGDLDITVIDALPEGRKPVRTLVVSDRQRQTAYAKVLKEISEGRQAYVVCPVIGEGKTDRKAALDVYEELSRGYLKGVKVGLIHGSMPKAEIDTVMRKFVENEIQVLVSTTVIEVGVDVPNATCMVIEDAESFGLASLHQLRGRVGRGSAESFCFLISKTTGDARSRLKFLEQCNDGFQVAELDLQNRGPGQFFGLRQHGAGETRLSDLSLSVEDIQRAREEARRIVDSPADETERRLLSKVKSRFGNLAQAGLSR